MQLVADLADRLIPADTRVHWPLASFIGYFKPAFAAHKFAHRGALGAMRAAIDRAVPARLLADPDVVGDFRRHRAADGAMRADAFADGDLGAGGRRRSGLGFAHRAERAARRALARPPAARPERRRKVRRSRPPSDLSGNAPAKDAAARLTFRSF